MIKVEIDIEVKKGVFAKTLWGVERTWVSPVLDARRRWTNGDGLFDRGAKPDVPDTYRVALLRNDAEVTDMRLRTAYAGYEEYLCSGKRRPANPGTFAYKGRDCGEITADIGRWSQWRQGCILLPAGALRSLLELQVEPKLREVIAENHDELRRDAVARTAERMEKAVEEARAEIDRAESEMRRVVLGLEGGDE